MTAFDASWWGCGDVQKRCSPAEIREAGKYNDRWRFSRAGESACASPARRDLDLDDDCLSGVRVPPISKRLWGGQFRRIASFPWDRSEHQTLLEGRSAVWVAKHLTRSVANFGRKHLLLGDALAIILTASKGRSSRPGMCRVSRQWAAYILAAQLYPAWRWLPSERNAGDSASRGGVRLLCF